MPIFSPIMLCCSAQIFDLLCPILCSRIRIVDSIIVISMMSHNVSMTNHNDSMTICNGNGRFT